MISTTTALWEALGRSKLLSREGLTRARTLLRGVEPREGAIRLATEGLLTTWQARQLLAGQKQFHLGKYKLLEELGRGGMGTVFKAEEQFGLQRPVAIKVMAPKLLDRPTSVQRFLREVQAVASLSHPNIVAAYEADRLGKHYYLVMEYVPGRDLNAWLKEHGRLPIDWACDCIRQAALGLQHAHERGLVHRDIKPSNVLVVAGDPGLPPLVKILDLGLARFTDEEIEEHEHAIGPAADDSRLHKDHSELTRTCEIMGTVDYVSPEQAQSTRNADIRADIFSLGCTLFKLLTGEVPYQGANTTEKLLARLEPARRVRALRPDVYQGLDDVVFRMMSRDPADRYQTPREVAAALEPYCHAKDPSSVKLLAETLAAPAVEVPLEVPASAVEDGSAGAMDFLQQLSRTSGPATPAPRKSSRGRKELRREWLTLRRQSKKWLVPAMAIGGSFAVLALLALLIFFSGPAASGAQLSLEIDQPGARVVIGDGEYFGISPNSRTPLVISLAPGVYNVRVEKDGFQPYRETVQLPANLVQTVRIRMTPRSAGALPTLTIPDNAPLPVGRQPREIARWALQIGGWVQYRDPFLPKLQDIKSLTNLAEAQGDLYSLSLANTLVRDEALNFFSELTSLGVLELDNTWITNEGLDGLPPLPKLTTIRLRQSRITDEGLKALRRHPSLLHVYLTSSRITDAGLKHFSGLAIRSLYLQNTKVRNEGLSFLRDLPDLTTLDLSETAVTEAGLATLAQLPKLKQLTLNDLKITDEGLLHLQSSKALTDLSLIRTQITEDGANQFQQALPGCKLAWTASFPITLVEAVKHREFALQAVAAGGRVHVWSDLRYHKVREPNDLPKKDVMAITRIDLAKTQIHDADLAKLGQLSTVLSLDLEGTAITDTALPQLETLARLTQLDLSNTRVTTAGIKSLLRLTRITSLRLSKTDLDDSSVIWLKHLPLRELSLRGNKLGDEGLHQLGDIKTLERLDIGFTGATNATVEILCKLPRLQRLSITRTQIDAAGQARLKAALPQLQIDP